jgi:uncharacterized membrane protein (UPF0127 family)
MKPVRLFALLLFGLAVCGGCQDSGNTSDQNIDLSEPREAQPRLSTIQLWLGAERLTAEMALTPEQIRTGMMFRTHMAENEGMLFVIPPQRASFWMKNCPLPLSAAYIDPDGVIREIHDLQPHNTNAVVSASDNIAYVLETTQGWFQRHQVREGMAVRSERGSLMETFRRGNQ